MVAILVDGFGGIIMKAVKLLLCAMIAFIMTSCCGLGAGPGLIFFVENKSGIEFLLEIGEAGILYGCERFIQLNETVRFGEENLGDGGGHIPVPEDFRNSLDFYTIIEHIDDDGKSRFYKEKLIKRFERADIVAERVEEHETDCGGYAVYKLVVTDKILGINAGNAVEADDGSFAGMVFKEQL
jgi:hypothetical protein